MSTITSTQPASATQATYSNPILPSSKSGLSKTAVQLSTDSSIVANLGGNNSTTPLYSAVGLLNTITEAGTNTAAGSTTTPTSTTGTSSTPSTTSQANPTESTAGSTNANNNWAQILAATPQAASALAAYTTNQGIVSTLSTTA